MIVFCAKYLLFIIGFLVLLFWATQKSNKKWQLALSLVLAAVIAFAASKIISSLYYHPRPFISSGIKPLFPHANDSGFPSDHTTGAIALAIVVYFYNKNLAAGLFILAILVGVSRMLSHVHSAVDIVGGIVLGLLSGWAGYWLARKLLVKQVKPPVI